MADDPREFRSKASGHTTFSSGNTGPNTVINIRPEETLSIEYLKVDYSDAGTTAAKFTLYDEPDGTTSGNLNDNVEAFYVTNGDTVILEDPELEDVTKDLVVESDGNQDDEVIVSVGGIKVTG